MPSVGLWVESLYHSLLLGIGYYIVMWLALIYIRQTSAQQCL